MTTRTLSNEQLERFKRLVLPCLDVLVRTARYMTRSQAEADDLVQDAMLKAMQNFDSLRREEGAKAWLLTIQRRACVDRYRSRGVDSGAQTSAELIEQIPDPSRSDAGAFDEHWDNPEGLLERFEDEEVVEALRALPEDIRWTLLLVDVQQLDQAQAAEILDVPLGTIKSRAHRGRGLLRDRLLEFARQRGWVPGEGREVLP